MNREDYVKKHGWKKHHGFIIDNSMICDEYDYTLVPMEQLKETMREGDFYLSDDGPGYEDITDVLEWLEDEEDYPDKFDDDQDRGKEDKLGGV